MKLTGIIKAYVKNESLPPRGAWIEIAILSIPSIFFLSSLPPRGAWIEIVVNPMISANTNGSLPPREAWIEIIMVTRKEEKVRSLPPRGAWIEISKTRWIRPWRQVAPPTGSVD